MKIAVVGTRGFPDVQGGVETHCEQLYTHLAKGGHDITVFTREPYVSTDSHIYKGVSLIAVSCPGNKFLEALVHTFISVLKARKLKPDILHIHAIGPSIFTPLARVFGMKVVVTSHGPDYKRKKWSLWAKLFLRFCEWTGMKFANEAIAVTDYISEDIRKKFDKKAIVIPNGIEVPLVLNTDDLLQKFGLYKKHYILAVGRFVPEKGFHDLINAFDDGDFEEWKLVIVGNADYEDRYSLDLKKMAGKNSKIILTGSLTGQPLQEIYSNAGIFVLASHYEGLPIVLLEAMSYGLSCIASDIPANRNLDLSRDRFFNAGNTKLLSEKIRYFINKPLGEAEREKQVEIITKKYNWNKIADETLKVYARAVS